MRGLIAERTGRDIARGALYTSLERLEGKGCLTSTMRDPAEDARAGRARRYFTVTAKGLAALRATHDALKNLTTGLEALLERP